MLIEDDEYRIWKKKMHSNAKSKITGGFGFVARGFISGDTIRTRYKYCCSSRYMKISQAYEIYKNRISCYKGFYECMHDYINVSDDDI